MSFSTGTLRGTTNVATGIQVGTDIFKTASNSGTKIQESKDTVEAKKYNAEGKKVTNVQVSPPSVHG